MSRVALVVGGVGGVVLVLTWRGRVRASAMERLTAARRHLLTVMLLTGATLSFGLTGYALQMYGFFDVVRSHGPIGAGWRCCRSWPRSS